jgi:DNA-binding transcriptional MocR family regulator
MAQELPFVSLSTNRVSARRRIAQIMEVNRATIERPYHRFPRRAGSVRPVVEDHLKSSLERLTIWRPSWSLLAILLPDQLRPRVRWFRQSLSGNSVHYRDT